VLFFLFITFTCTCKLCLFTQLSKIERWQTSHLLGTLTHAEESWTFSLFHPNKKYSFCLLHFVHHSFINQHYSSVICYLNSSRYACISNSIENSLIYQGLNISQKHMKFHRSFLWSNIMAKTQGFNSQWWRQQRLGCRIFTGRAEITTTSGVVLYTATHRAGTSYIKPFFTYKNLSLLFLELTDCNDDIVT